MGNSDSNFKIMLQAVLDKIKSITNIISDIKAIEPKLPRIKIQGKFDMTAMQRELNSKMKVTRTKVNVDADTTRQKRRSKRSKSRRIKPPLLRQWTIHRWYPV